MRSHISVNMHILYIKSNIYIDNFIKRNTNLCHHFMLLKKVCFIFRESYGNSTWKCFYFILKCLLQMSFKFHFKFIAFQTILNGYFWHCKSKPIQIHHLRLYISIRCRKQAWPSKKQDFTLNFNSFVVNSFNGVNIYWV